MQDSSAAHILQQNQQYETPNKTDTQSNTSPSSLQQQSRNIAQFRVFQSQKCTKDHKITQLDIITKTNGQLNFNQEKQQQQNSTQEWPEINAIVVKITKVQNQLNNEKNINRQFSRKLKQYQAKIKSFQDEKDRYLSSINQQQSKNQELLNRIKGLQDQNNLKQFQINQQKQTISQVQIHQIKKTAQLQEKLKKSAIEHKEITDKIRKINTELQIQKKINKELKSEMINRIDRMQSGKQQYLISQISKLKQIIQTTKQQKQLSFLQEIGQLNKRIYQFEEQIKRKNIQLNLMERMKEQAVNEANQKKDQQIKKQKVLYKALNQKFSKLQEDIKNMKKQNLETARNNRLIQNQRTVQEEITLQFSPEKQ